MKVKGELTTLCLKRFIVPIIYCTVINQDITYLARRRCARRSRLGTSSVCNGVTSCLDFLKLKDSELGFRVWRGK